MTFPCISQVAITPDVFEDALYEGPSDFRQGMANLFNGLRATGLVANMHGGEWINFVTSQLGGKRLEVTKLFKMLIERERLIDAPSVSATAALQYEDWLEEAQKLLRKRAVQGVISTLHETPGDDTVHPTDLNRVLGEARSWWIDDPTEDLQCTIPCRVEYYKKVLEPVLLHSSKVVFYDKFLDPSDHGYRNFGKLLAICAKSTKRDYLRIELHRTVPRMSDPNSMLVEDGWRLRFAPLQSLVKTYGLRIQVCIWHPKTVQRVKHPRYVLSKVGSFIFDQGFVEKDKEDNKVLFMGRKLTQEFERSLDQNVSQPKYAFKLTA